MLYNKTNFQIKYEISDNSLWNKPTIFSPQSFCFQHEHNINMWIHEINNKWPPEKYINYELHFLTHDNNKDCVRIRRSKTRNISAEELFKEMQYLGRLYDHDPDNIKAIQNLQKILLANESDYSVDSMMKSVCLTTKYLPHFTYYSTPPSRICLLIFISFLLIVSDLLHYSDILHFKNNHILGLQNERG